MNLSGTITLPRSLGAWNTPTFNETAREEISQLDPKLLPLQQGVTQGSYANEKNFSIVILSASEKDDVISVKAGIFYTSVIAGCNCADDPAPVDELTEYCEIQIAIDKKTARSIVSSL